jgi:hypothetical protein
VATFYQVYAVPVERLGRTKIRQGDQHPWCRGCAGVRIFLS